ncbi:MAG: hypothetical protein LBG78_09855 [Azoarcus sp.]|nr:hypothetical protein [Azoarcus sp.]
MRIYVIAYLSSLALAACAAPQSDSTTASVHFEHLTNDADKLIAALSYCDNRLFEEIYKNKEQLKAFAPIATNGTVSHFVVENRAQREKGVVKFSKPLIGKVSIIGYEDWSPRFDSLGEFYYWGFHINGTVDYIQKAILPLLAKAKWLKRDGNFYVIPELYNLNRPDLGWSLENNITGGRVAARDTLERVLIIEQADASQPGVTTVLCTVQGRQVPAKIIQVLRPDIKAH